MANAVANKSNTVVAPLDAFRHELDARTQQFHNALPQHFPVEKFKINLLAAVGGNPDLAKCNRASLLRAAMSAAQLGLMVEPTLGQAYIVAYGSKGQEQKVAQLIVGYKGLLHLARQSGDISTVYAHVVHAKDEFDYQLGLDKRLHHKPASGDRGQPIGAYCVWKDKHGNSDFEWMDAGEIEKIRARSPGGNFGPWKTDTLAMWRKTVIRRASKYFSLSVQRAAVLDAVASGGGRAHIDEHGEVRVEEQPKYYHVADDGEIIDEPTADNEPPPHEEPTAPAPKATVAKQTEKLAAATTRKPAAQPSQPFALNPPNGKDGKPDWKAFAVAAMKLVAPMDGEQAQQFMDANGSHLGTFAFMEPELSAKLRALINPKLGITDDGEEAAET